MSDLFGNHVVDFVMMRLKYFGMFMLKWTWNADLVHYH